MSCNIYQYYLGTNQGAIGNIQAGFSEQDLCGLVAQPANTISSLAYLVVALLLYKKFKSIIILALFVSLSIGSIALHATSTRVGQILDFGSMFGVISYLLYLTLNLRYNISKKVLIPIILILGFIELLILIYFVQYRILFLGIVLICLLLLENRAIIKQNLESKNWRLAWIVFLISFLFWLGDEFRLVDVSSIQHIINLHAIWHLGTAYSLYLSYIHFESKAIIRPLS